MNEELAHSEARRRFLDRFGNVVEHSPWVAQAVWERYPTIARVEDPQDLVEVFGRVIRGAPREQRMELLRAHPDLACGVVASSQLTDVSRDEQKSAGLDQCSPQEFIEFQSLNLEYKARFGFPFILAVTGLDRKEILSRFRNRIERSPEEEFTAAIENVVRIVGFRISDILARDD